MKLFHLAFVSLRVSPMDDGALNDLRRTASTNNAARGVTGLLLTSRGRFMEFVEGDVNVIGPLFARVCNDRRHSDVRSVYFAPTERRLFQTWSFGVLDQDAAPPTSTYDEIRRLFYRYASVDQRDVARAFDVFGSRTELSSLDFFLMRPGRNRPESGGAF